jgi:hypothetical protein
MMTTAAWVSGQQPPAGGGAQGRGGQQAPPQNLQVLPKDINRQELVGLMRGINQALGVECNFCHVAEGRGGRNDYAADEKAPKKAAREMMKLTMHANEMVPAAVGKTAADATRVQCWTCHRGERTPSAPPALPPPAAPGGGAAPNPGR